MEKISAIVLSGGNAERLGGEKPFRKFNNDYLIDNTINVLVEMKIPFVVVFKHLMSIKKGDIPKESYIFKRYGQSITWDLIPNKGPIVGILSGMKVIEGNWILVLPCDMPFITKDSINALLNYIPVAKSKGYNCIIPKHDNGHVEPLFSLYEKSSVVVLENLVKEAINKEKSIPIRGLIHNLNPLYVPSKKIDNTMKTFVNINTFEDFEKNKFKK
ncbi:molybdenum cofactor guanylyltransferase [Methanothermococcus sp. SCGC AD-155-C09]|nr:molybdenum cofactor guanylyltransferase [Methanothermococcus sp. SCGC AD-155-C09]